MKKKKKILHQCVISSSFEEQQFSQYFLSFFFLNMPGRIKLPFISVRLASLLQAKTLFGNASLGTQQTEATNIY